MPSLSFRGAAQRRARNPSPQKHAMELDRRKFACFVAMYSGDAVRAFRNDRCPVVIPGRAEGVSPESMTTGHAMALDRRKSACFVAMDSGHALRAFRNDTIRRHSGARPRREPGIHNHGNATALDRR